MDMIEIEIKKHRRESELYAEEAWNFADNGDLDSAEYCFKQAEIATQKALELERELEIKA
jgi:hypothetical protein